MSNENVKEIKEEEVKTEDLEETTNIEVEEEVVLNNEENIEDENIQDIAEEPKKTIEKIKINNGFLKNFMMSLIDQIIVLFLGLVVMIVTDLVLKLFGYQVIAAERSTFFLIIYAIVNIVYLPLCKLGKFERTIGYKIIE